MHPKEKGPLLDALRLTSPCVIPSQALLPLAIDGDEASQITTVANEWCRAVQDAADAPAGAAPAQREGWHVFTDDGPLVPRRDTGWYKFEEGKDLRQSSAASGTHLHGVTGTRAPALQHSIWPVRGVSPLEVTNAQWTEGVVSQSSPFPDGENVISVTFSANVPLGPAQVRQRRLVPAFSLAIRHRAWRLYSHLLL